MRGVASFVDIRDIETLAATSMKALLCALVLAHRRAVFHPGHADIVVALLQLLLSWSRMIHDAHEKCEVLLEETISGQGRWTIDYFDHIDARFIGPDCSNSSPDALRV